MNPVWSVVVLGACAASPRTHTTTTTGPPYLGLFVAGRVWSLPIELATGTRRGDAFVTSTTEHGTLRCAASELRHVGDASIVRIACDKPHDDLLISGSWVAETAGLYHPSIPITDPDELATLGGDELLVNAIPAERHHDHGLDTAQATIETFRDGGGWCVRESIVAELERRDYTLCFDATGMIGGSDLVVVDQTWRRARFGKAGTDSRDDE